MSAQKPGGMKGWLEGLAQRAARYRFLVFCYRAFRRRIVRLRRRAYIVVNGRCPSLVRLYFSWTLRPQKGAREYWFDLLSRRTENFTFIQVGANDGFSNDPIHRYVVRHDWSGILLEPQPRVFEAELSELHRARPNLFLLNAAIDREPCHRTLYYLNFSDARWATGLSSFSKDRLVQELNFGTILERAEMENLAPQGELISSYTVPTVTFDELLDTYRLSELHLLQIDCEGYDGEILRMFPFHRIIPRMINFEHLHRVLSASVLGMKAA